MGLDRNSSPPLAPRAADFLLVLDDFHTIDDGAIHEALQTLVAHQPPHMHLVIVTREDPPLPLARLRALGQLTELRADDLRFSPEETGLFLREVMGLALDARDIQELDAHIEGWVARLQLAALSMQHRPDPAGLIADLGGTHYFIICSICTRQTPSSSRWTRGTSGTATITSLPRCSCLNFAAHSPVSSPLSTRGPATGTSDQA